ncbi:MAG: class I adenylate-forming enzyme family protein [Bacillota bacterium]
MFEQMFKELCLAHIPIVMCAENFPDGKMALTDLEAGRNWTYRELNRDINRLAHAFQGEGLEKGDVVMTSLLNSAESIIAIYAGFKAGVVSSPINFRLAVGEVAYHLEDSRPKIYIYDPEIESIVKKALEMSAHNPQRVLSTGELAGYMEGRPETEPENITGVTPFDECLRLYTSGTTGRAKGVPLSHFANYICCFMVVALDSWTPGHKILAFSPYFHRAGNNAGFMPALSIGAHVFTMKHFDPVAALNAIEKAGINFLVGAPPMFAAMSRVVRMKKGEKSWDLSSLQAIDTMGAPLDRDTYLAMKETLCEKVYNSDGNTEAGWVIKQSPWAPAEKYETNPVMNGVPMPFHFVRVVKRYPDRKADPGDLVARDGVEKGEMIVRSPFQAVSYHNKPDKTAESFRDGWFYTGDAVTWDKDGYFMIHGRSGDMILTGAENVYPDEVEAILLEHPKVRDCVVVGVPDPDGILGSVIVAYIVPEDGSLTAAELDGFCREHPMLARFKRPRYYRITGEIPYTATGKRIRYVVRERARKDMEEGMFTKV